MSRVNWTSSTGCCWALRTVADVPARCRWGTSRETRRCSRRCHTSCPSPTCPSVRRRYRRAGENRIHRQRGTSRVVRRKVDDERSRPAARGDGLVRIAGLQRAGARRSAGCSSGSRRPTATDRPGRARGAATPAGARRSGRPRRATATRRARDSRFASRATGTCASGRTGRSTGAADSRCARARGSSGAGRSGHACRSASAARPVPVDPADPASFEPPPDNPQAAIAEAAAAAVNNAIRLPCPDTALGPKRFALVVIDASLLRG